MPPVNFGLIVLLTRLDIFTNVLPMYMLLVGEILLAWMLQSEASNISVYTENIITRV